MIFRDRSLITGEGGLVEKEGGWGSDIFVHEKRGGAKHFVQYKYQPCITPSYHKPTDKNREK
jgi:hypothetical protein